MSKFLHYVGSLLIADRMITKAMTVTRSTNVQKRTSNKSKLKQTKSKPSTQYKSTKPVKSKSVSQFRNKSNI